MIGVEHQGVGVAYARRFRRVWQGVAVLAAMGAAYASSAVAVDRPQAGSSLEEHPSPLTATSNGDQGALYLTYDAVAAEALPSSGSFVLKAFPLTQDRCVDLLLERFDVLAPGATVVVGTGAGDVPLALGDVALYHGRVLSSAGSSAYLSLSSSAQHGFIVVDGRTYTLSSGPPTEANPPAIIDLSAMPSDGQAGGGFECFTDTSGFVSANPGSTDDDGADIESFGARCRVAQVAIETDWEYTGSIFGGDTQRSAAYAMTLLGAVSEIYTRDINTRVRVSFLRVWDSDVDPYAGGGLGEFQNYWNANMGYVPRHAAHILSPMYGGGVAYLPGLCNWGYEYGLSGALGGYFPYPLRDHDTHNWDPFVVSHELGHNFGAPHTHDHQPPIDGCGLGDCTLRLEGTIMSYCHLCIGGMYNISLKFADRTITEAILPYLDYGAHCDLTSDAACAVTCGDIKRLRARCKSYGALVVKVVLYSDMHTGQDVILSFNGSPHAFRIMRDRVNAFYCCPQYPVTIEFESPADCEAPLVLNCP